jgi:hypothetical protein
VLAGDKRPLAPEVIMAELCRTMGWTWNDYLAQPQWLIDTLLGMMSAEGDKSRQDSDTSKSKSALQ